MLLYSSPLSCWKMNRVGARKSAGCTCKRISISWRGTPPPSVRQDRCTTAQAASRVAAFGLLKPHADAG